MLQCGPSNRTLVDGEAFWYRGGSVSELHLKSNAVPASQHAVQLFWICHDGRRQAAIKGTGHGDAFSVRDWGFELHAECVPIIDTGAKGLRWVSSLNCGGRDAAGCLILRTPTAKQVGLNFGSVPAC